jgi:hypothetical protein
VSRPGNAVDRGDECNAYERSHTPKGRWVNATRCSLLKAPDKQSIPQLALLGEWRRPTRRCSGVHVFDEQLRRGCGLQPCRSPERGCAASHVAGFAAE